MTALSNATLTTLPPLVLTPGYNRKETTPGIAHLAVGNFHRAHQALYIDRVLAVPGNRAGLLLALACATTHAKVSVQPLCTSKTAFIL